MNFIDIIKKKRDKFALNDKDISYFIQGILDGSIPDYQISALMMAIYLNGMTEQETYLLTKYMVGDIIEFYQDDKFVDKHSTGGIGDKLTLIIVPLVVAAGLTVCKMSGKGLGFSGGTIDKLASIPGFKTTLKETELEEQIKKIRIAIIGQSTEVALADKKLYALRDVTGTVESIPLIASSIVSKKIASGNRNIVFDVKAGSGAFMKNLSEAETLAKTLVKLVEMFGGKGVAVITNMDSPLGHYIGNSLEIMEVLETLKGNGPSDLVELTKEIGSYMLTVGGIVKDHEEGKSIIDKLIDNGQGLKKLAELIEFQGGEKEVIADYKKMPQGAYVKEIYSVESGYINKINSQLIGEVSVRLGAGRSTKEDQIDYGAGIFIPKKVGEQIEKGELIGRLYYSSNLIDIGECEEIYSRAFAIAITKNNCEKLIYKVIS